MTASVTTTSLLAGTHALTATYTGDAFADDAMAAPATDMVTRRQTTTAVSWSENPSTNGAVTITAPPRWRRAPTGSVTSSDGATVLGAARLALLLLRRPRR